MKYAGYAMCCLICYRTIDHYVSKCLEKPDDWDIKNEIQGTELAAGYMRKKGKGGIDAWSKRFIVIDKNRLIYYDTHNRRVQKGEIVLVGCSAVITPHRLEEHKKFYFTISHPTCSDREFYCKSAMRRAQWLKTINDVSTKLKATGFYGKLEKLGGTRKNSWQERWCVCAWDSMDYFEKAGDTKTRGDLKLQGATINIVERSDREFCFDVVVDGVEIKTTLFGYSKSNKTYTFAAPSQMELEQWVDVLETAAVSTNSLYGLGLGASPEGKGSDGGGGRGGGSGIPGIEMVTNPMAVAAPTRSQDSDKKEERLSIDSDEGIRDESLTSIDLRASSVSAISAAGAAGAASNILMEGYLEKKSKNSFAFGAWQARWFIIDQSSLRYFKHKTDLRDGNDEKGTIKLSSIIMEKGINLDASNPCIVYFLVIEGNRKYELRAQSHEDATSWKVGITDAVERYKATV